MSGIPQKLPPFTHKVSQAIQKAPWMDIAAAATVAALLVIAALANLHIIGSVGHLSNLAIQYTALGAAGGVIFADVAVHILKRCIKGEKQAKIASKTVRRQAEETYITVPPPPIASYDLSLRGKDFTVELKGYNIDQLKENFQGTLNLAASNATKAENELDIAMKALQTVAELERFTGQVSVQAGGQVQTAIYNYGNRIR